VPLRRVKDPVDVLDPADPPCHRWTTQMPPGAMACVLPLGSWWMFEAVIIGWGLSTPGLFSGRRRIRR
jgi:hypothetical protein